MKNTNFFLEKFTAKRTSFSYYIIGSIIIIFFNFFGQIPLLAVLSNSLLETDIETNPINILNILDKNLAFFLILFPFLISFIAFFFVVKKIHLQSFTSVTTSRKNIDIKKISFGFKYWSLLSISIFLFELIISPDDYIYNFNFFPFLIMTLIALTLIPFQSALEELIFRGYLMQGFSKMLKNRYLPLIITSFIFGFLHFFNPEVDKLGNGIMFYYVGTGFFFGIITLMDEGTELAVGLHIANNLITALLVTADWTAFQTESLYIDISEPSLGIELFIYLVIIYPITLLYFSKKFNWSNWRKKLI